MGFENETTDVEFSLGSGENKAQIRYSIASSIFHGDHHTEIPVYGIHAELVRDKTTISAETVHDITPSLETCKEIIRLLAKNTVTPATLKDVVEDLVANDLKTNRPVSSEIESA